MRPESPGTAALVTDMTAGVYFVLAFENTHEALRAERALRAWLPVAVMPTLRQITASCGISLRAEVRDRRALIAALGAKAVPEGAYRLYRVQNGVALPCTCSDLKKEELE